MKVKQTTVLTYVAAVIGTVLLFGAGAAAQTPAPDAERLRAREAIATMEAVLATAINSGAQRVIAQVRTAMPSDRPPRLASAPRVSGWRLKDYGVLFNVQVPMLQLPITWEVRQIVQESQNRQLAMIAQQMRTQLTGMAPGPERSEIERNLFQLEQQLRQGRVRVDDIDRGTVTAATVVAVPTPSPVARVAPEPFAIDDPEEAYTHHVKAALIDAMLQNSQSFSLAPQESLTIVAQDAVAGNPLVPGDRSSVWIMSVKGSDLSALRSGSITIEEARARVDVQEE